MQKQAKLLRLVAFTATLLALAPGAWTRSSGASLESQADVVVDATVISSDEVWDRRSDPLMGRPDVLKEITLRLGSLDVQRGPLPKVVATISVSIRTEALLIKFRRLSQGSHGRFYLQGQAQSQPFRLLDAEIAVAAKSKPTPPYRLTKPPYTPPPQPAKSPFENVKARDLKASPSLQRDVLRFIADYYHMSDVKLVYLTSFSGPMPPEGGYVYWGVTGMIHGKAHIWQQGSPQVRLGSELIDPKRFQK